MGDQRIQQTVLDCFLSLPVALKQSRSSKRYGPSPGMEFNSAIGLSSLYRCSRKPSNSKNNRIIPKQRATTMLFRYCQSFFFFFLRQVGYMVCITIVYISMVLSLFLLDIWCSNSFVLKTELAPCHWEVLIDHC